jgi:hypothetical protein
MTEPDALPFARLAALASEQGGCFSRRQALAAGLTRGLVERALGRGEWLRLHPGVFTWAGMPLGTVGKQWAAIVACQDDEPERVSAISHRSAAATIGTRAFTADHLVEISTARATRPRLQRVQLHRVRDLTSDDVTTKYGPPTTTPSRTLIDLAPSLSPRLITRVMEEWLADRKVTIADLRADIERLSRRGRTGPRTLEAHLDGRTLGDEIADSGLEAELGDLLTRYAVPLPVHHFIVDHEGHVVAEVDWSYPEAMVAIEVNGYGVHLMHRDRWEDDLDRHNAITSLGWSVLYYSKRAMRRSPRKIAREVDAHRLARTAQNR